MRPAPDPSVGTAGASRGDDAHPGDADIADAAHRPWPLPAAPWAMAMSWLDLLFLHWPLDPDVLAPFIPPPLVLDTFDGRAWLGVVPFRMAGVRLRGLPPIPGTAAFPEINVRTYAVAPDGRRGVWFFSLDATSRLAVRAARAWFGLPYFDAEDLERARVFRHHLAARAPSRAERQNGRRGVRPARIQNSSLPNWAWTKASSWEAYNHIRMSWNLLLLNLYRSEQ
ncbi:MAG: DUF2071 domain-containing protein [Anaerolineae bacterium]